MPHKQMMSIYFIITASVTMVCPFICIIILALNFQLNNNWIFILILNFILATDERLRQRSKNKISTGVAVTIKNFTVKTEPPGRGQKKLKNIIFQIVSGQLNYYVVHFGDI